MWMDFKPLQMQIRKKGNNPIIWNVFFTFFIVQNKGKDVIF